MSQIRRRHGQENEETQHYFKMDPNLKGDEKNVAILLFLYLLQGIPLGLSSAIPMMLQSKGASLNQQAEFSFVNWPFSLKLAWAPLVDAIYFQRFGRRKTWLVPAQYLIGIFMVFLSFHVDHWLGMTHEVVNEDGIEHVAAPSVMPLTICFFILNFLAATQDIAVDGWALTMLKRRNVSYASTCNSVGQTMGYFLGYVVFIALESAEFCNGYLRTIPEDVGIVTLPGFLYFWGTTYIVTTTLVAALKSEAPEPNSKLKLDSKEAALASYKQLIEILKLPAVRSLALLLLTVKIGFAASDAVTSLKLMEGGVPKDRLAMLAIPLVPIQIALPIILAKFHDPTAPLSLYIKVIPYRLAFNFVAAFFVYVTPHIIVGSGIPAFYYILLLFILILHQTTMYCMFVEAMSFFARISDPSAGGTNMTLLNTLHNLGGTWTSTVALWMAGVLTWKKCSADESNTCGDSSLVQECEAADGLCNITFDGYYLEMAICTAVGFLWYLICRRRLHSIQMRPLQDWHVLR